MLEVITRAEAIKRGLKRYFTGKPCKHGHVTDRWTAQGSCVECVSLRAKSPEGKASGSIRSDKYRNSSKGKERRKNNRKEYYNKNSDEEKEYARIRRINNEEHYKQRLRGWRQNNKEACIAYNRNRRARLIKAEGAHTIEDIKTLFDQQKGVCLICGCDLRVHGQHVDHMVPLVKGGSNSPDNLQLLCPKCNTSKGVLLMDEFWWREWKREQQ